MLKVKDSPEALTIILNDIINVFVIRLDKITL